MTRRAPKIQVFDHGTLDTNLTKVGSEVSRKVRKDYCLDYPDINFYMVDLDELASIVASHGWVMHPQHWSLGQSYYIIREKHRLLPGGIAEIVVDSGAKEGNHWEPINAYIYSLDDEILRKLVITHVFGHAHMFYNNWKINEGKPWSTHSMMYDNTQKVYEIEKELGQNKVEEFIDALYSIQTLIDLYPGLTIEEKLKEQNKLSINKSLINSLIESSESIEDKLIKSIESKGVKPQVPEFRTYDVLKFLEDNAPLADWERDLVRIYGEQNRFLYKGALCKILHEGLADLVEWRYAVENNLNFGDSFDWLKEHQFTQMHNHPGHIKEGYNPYALGFAMLKHVLVKYGEGRVGIDYDLNTYKDRRDTDNELININWSKGWNKVLEVVRDNTDYTFIDEFFTPEFYNEYGDVFFVYEGENYSWDKKMVTSREFLDVRNTLLFENYNLKLPRVFVKEGGGNHKNKGELYLVQDLSNITKLGIKPQQLTLDQGKLESVLRSLYKVWRKPVNLETIDVIFDSDDSFDNDRLYWYQYYGKWPMNWPDLNRTIYEEPNAKVHRIIATFNGQAYFERHFNKGEAREHNDGRK